MRTIKKIQKEKFRHSDWFLVAAAPNTIKTAPKVQLLKKNDAFKKEQHTCTIIAWSYTLGFHPEKSPRLQNNAFNKAISYV
jgi:hypothetical protein